jgi:hypothetical protein
MSGRRDMFNILNVRMDDRTSGTPLLHHTRHASSEKRMQKELRFRHFQHLGTFCAKQQCCNPMENLGRLTGSNFCQ